MGNVYELIDEKMAAIQAALDQTIQEKLDEKFKELKVPTVEEIVAQIPVPGSRADEREKVAEIFGAMAKYMFTKDAEVLKAVQKDFNLVTGEEGGYLLPEKLMTTLIDVTKPVTGDDRIVAGAKTVPLASKRTTWPTLTSKGGAIQWIDEGGAIDTNSQASATFGQFVIETKKGGIPLVATREFVTKNPTVTAGQFLMNLLTEKAREGIADVIVNGRNIGGTYIPYGFMNHPNAIEVVLDAGKTSFTDVDFDALKTAFYSMPDKYVNKAVWVVNKTIVSVLSKIKDTTGRYIWVGPTDKEPPTMFGRPVIISDRMPSLADSAADTAFIAFVDLSQFWHGYWGAPTMDIYKERIGDIDLAGRDMLAYVIRFWYGGNWLNGDAIVRVKTAAS